MASSQNCPGLFTPPPGTWVGYGRDCPDGHAFTWGTMAAFVDAEDARSPDLGHVLGVIRPIRFADVTVTVPGDLAWRIANDTATVEDLDTLASIFSEASIEREAEQDIYQYSTVRSITDGYIPSHRGRMVTVEGIFFQSQKQDSLIFGVFSDPTGSIRMHASMTATHKFQEFGSLPDGLLLEIYGEITITPLGEMSIKIAGWEEIDE